MNTSRKTFSLDTPLNLEQYKWLLGSTDPDVCNSVFILGKNEKKKFDNFLRVIGLML